MEDLGEVEGKRGVKYMKLKKNGVLSTGIFDMMLHAFIAHVKKYSKQKT